MVNRTLTLLNLKTTVSLPKVYLGLHQIYELAYEVLSRASRALVPGILAVDIALPAPYLDMECLFKQVELVINQYFHLVFCSP